MFAAISVMNCINKSYAHLRPRPHCLLSAPAMTVAIIRPARLKDADEIAEIYAPVVEGTAVSLEVEPPSAEEIFYPTLLDFQAPNILACSRETVVAEKSFRFLG